MPADLDVFGGGDSSQKLRKLLTQSLCVATSLESVQHGVTLGALL
jgi:hypothetical protein